jgi:transcriptional regulator NrdR family protein
MKVVEEVESGLISIVGAQKLYGIPGNATISEWIQKYGINQKIERTVYVMSSDEERELIRLRKENRRLEKALEDKEIKVLALESLVELIEEEYHVDVKKNFGSKVLEELRKKLLPSTSGPAAE